MSRRARAVTFASAAAICAGLAAGATGGAQSGIEAQIGELRPVLVATEPLPAGRPLARRTLSKATEIRRVPATFLPPDALTAPEQLVGRRPATTVPAGSYILASHLRAPQAGEPEPTRKLDAGTRPVEIAVSGAGALASQAKRGRRVDVVVTADSRSGAAGRTYVAARGVELIELRPADAEGGGGELPAPALDAWVATLALTRGQALRLIHAESFARSVRVIAAG